MRLIEVIEGNAVYRWHFSQKSYEEIKLYTDNLERVCNWMNVKNRNQRILFHSIADTFYRFLLNDSSNCEEIIYAVSGNTGYLLISFGFLSEKVETLQKNIAQLNKMSRTELKESYKEKIVNNNLSLEEEVSFSLKLIDLKGKLESPIFCRTAQHTDTLDKVTLIITIEDFFQEENEIIDKSLQYEGVSLSVFEDYSKWISNHPFLIGQSFDYQEGFRTHAAKFLTNIENIGRLLNFTEKKIGKINSITVDLIFSASKFKIKDNSIGWCFSIFKTTGLLTIKYNGLPNETTEKHVELIETYNSMDNMRLRDEYKRIMRGYRGSPWSETCVFIRQISGQKILFKIEEYDSISKSMEVIVRVPDLFSDEQSNSIVT